MKRNNLQLLLKEAETKVNKIQEELTDKVDEYFPKIKPNGLNKGRGEAMVLVGIAIARASIAFSSLLKRAYHQGVKDERAENYAKIKSLQEAMDVKELLKLLEEGKKP
jgi:hypothetical protein